jgi:urease accessory protein
VRARARVVAERDGRRGTRLTALRSEAPLVLRSTPDALYLVGGAGGPLGGDDLALDITVGAGARLTVRTAAASVALPGAGPSEVHVRATVAAGGELRWLPEPVVAAGGCVHHMQATIDLEDGAVLVWREELVLGRHGEIGGSVVTRASVDLAGQPLLRHELALGPRFPSGAGPAVTAGARAVGSLVLVGLEVTVPAATLGPTSAVLPLAGAGEQIVALAGGAVGLRRLLDAGHRQIAALSV